MKKTKKKHHISINQIFFITVFLTILTPTVLFTLFLNNVSKTLVVERVYDDNYIAVHSTADFLDNYLLDSERLLAGLKTNIEDFTLTHDQLLLLLDSRINDHELITSIEVLDSDGLVIANAPNDDAFVGMDRSNETFITELTNTTDSYWSSPFIPPFKEDLHITISYKTDDYYIVGLLDLSTISENIQALSLSTELDKNTVLLDRYGIYISDKDETLVNSRQKAKYFDEMVTHSNLDNSIILDIDGYDNVVSYTNISNTGWYIIIYENFNSATAYSRTIINYFSYFTIFLVILLVLVFLTSSYLYKSNLDKLASKIKLMKNGDFSKEVEVSGFREIYEIGSVFNTMSNSINEKTTKLEYLAFNDELTGLYNRVFCKEFFEENHTIKSKYLTFVYIDLQRFELINDSYGFDFGNLVLKTFANKLKNKYSKEAIVARIESDEFLLIFETNNNNLEEMAKEIDDFLKTPTIIDGIDFDLNINFGLFYAESTLTFDDAMSSALITLNHAKQNLKQSYEIYEESMKSATLRQNAIELALEKALKEDEFNVYFQPIVNLKTEDIRGFEALSRWKHQVIGDVFPYEFITILERTQKIHLLDYQVLKKAIKHVKELSRIYKKDYVLSVNMSASSILNDNFIPNVKAALKKYDFNPLHLELEITESTIIQDFTKVNDKFNQLRALGVRLSEDDFGDGYSSLSYLTAIDLSTLKISKNFLKNIEINSNNKMLIETIIELSKKFGFETIAEGIENEETLNIMKELNPDYIQGYYFYRPMPYKTVLRELDKLYKKN
ncbi:hypothetical protein CI105_08845 [Candidatus Izimaplasma bacterium ZiA1]|uniref:bifunctional diguanylate cyclase/phosphodiesterase n=1 Tax=Candidatus Izimoplasma sp. ZiA1 TaxID=2024899 RepID=UPI000BAA6CFA|nr:hypothetical protein CI105_08845 [Candidatus Izimaplasma bacterium ZiA1]